MKFLITGLGNPGREYEMTRHNAGFRIVDFLAKEAGQTFSPDRHGETCSIKHKGRQLILLKPNTFMNLSGKAVRFHLEKNGIEIQNLLVLTDDLALPLGKLRMKPKGSAGGHNGLTDIEQTLNTQEYPRLRVGVGNEFPKGAQVDFVLSDFSDDEEKILKEVIEKAAKMVLSFATAGIDRTMSGFNN